MNSHVQYIHVRVYTCRLVVVIDQLRMCMYLIHVLEQIPCSNPLTAEKAGKETCTPCKCIYMCMYCHTVYTHVHVHCTRVYCMYCSNQVMYMYICTCTVHLHMEDTVMVGPNKP